MWTHILLKLCVLTNVAQHNHIPCFGYALVLAIKRLFTDLTGVQYHAANENRMINEVSACFKTSGVQYGPVDCTQYNLFLPCLPQNSRLIVVDAKFQSCTIAGACMNVLRTFNLKPNSIGRVLVNGYRSLRNYSNKSMEWITYCEKITGVYYRHAWSVGGEMYLKKAKAWAEAYYTSPRHE